METLAYLYSAEETEISATDTFFDDHFFDLSIVDNESYELTDDEINALEQSMVWMMP